MGAKGALEPVVGRSIPGSYGAPWRRRRWVWANWELRGRVGPWVGRLRILGLGVMLNRVIEGNGNYVKKIGYKNRYKNKQKNLHFLKK